MASATSLARSKIWIFCSLLPVLKIWPLTSSGSDSRAFMKALDVSFTCMKGRHCFPSLIIGILPFLKKPKTMPLIARSNLILPDAPYTVACRRAVTVKSLSAKGRISFSAIRLAFAYVVSGLGADSSVMRSS